MQVPYQSAHSAALGEMCVTEIPTRVFTLRPWVRCGVYLIFFGVTVYSSGVSTSSTLHMIKTK